MAIFDRDKDRGRDKDKSKDKDLPGDMLRALPRGDYAHGHPGLPPKDYEAPKEKRR